LGSRTGVKECVLMTVLPQFDSEFAAARRKPTSHGPPRFGQCSAIADVVSCVFE